MRCAVRSDGSSPAHTFLELLKSGRWEEDPDSEQIPDDEQVKDHHWFIEAIRCFADEGEPPYRHAINDLQDGVWEFKKGRKRLSFFDTDGEGGYTPKLRIRDYHDADVPDSEHWDVPNFDENLRLGHAFPKLGQKTRSEDLTACADIREEDLSHDR